MRDHPLRRLPARETRRSHPPARLRPRREGARRQPGTSPRRRPRCLRRGERPGTPNRPPAAPERPAPPRAPRSRRRGRRSPPDRPATPPRPDGATGRAAAHPCWRLLARIGAGNPIICAAGGTAGRHRGRGDRSPRPPVPPRDRQGSGRRRSSSLCRPRRRPWSPSTRKWMTPALRRSRQAAPWPQNERPTGIPTRVARYGKRGTYTAAPVEGFRRGQGDAAGGRAVPAPAPG
jgi:hypothetical protein